MGTPGFGVPALKYLVGRGFPVAAVVTQPDRPQGRKLERTPSEVKQAALALRLDVLQPEKINLPEFVEQLRARRPEAIVVAAFGQILKREILELPAYGCLNLHGSLLPKYRGAAPIQWALANGEPETGVTVQRMVEAVDAGNILAWEKIPVGPEETGPELFARLSGIGGPVLERGLLASARGDLGVPQNPGEATFAPRLTRESGRLDWTRHARELHNRVRAFFPWPGTYAGLKGGRLKILKTRLLDAPAPDGARPGEILAADPELGWQVACGDHSRLRVMEVQAEGGKPMPAWEFGMGHGAAPGLKLSNGEDTHGKQAHYDRG